MWMEGLARPRVFDSLFRSMPKCLGILIDFKGGVHYDELAADQGIAAAQNNYGICLENGKDIGIDMKGATHYSKLAEMNGSRVSVCSLVLEFQKI
jgi:TPR repeat protein